MNRQIVVFGKMSLLMFVAFVFAFSSLAMAAPKGEPINMGMITNLGAPYGATAKISMDISVQEINNAGGIMGRPVRLIVEDWKRQVPLAVAAYRKLVMKDKCVVVFTEGSEAVVALLEEGSKLYSAYPHVQIGNYVSADQLTEDTVCGNYDKYKFFFRPFSRAYDTYDPNMNTMQSLLKLLGTKKVALVIEDIAYTRNYLTGRPGRHPALKDFIEKFGVKVVLVTQTASNEKMFLPTFELIAKSGADTMVWAGAYTNHQTVAKQWAESAAKDIELLSFSGASSYKNFMTMTEGTGLGWLAQFPEIDIPYTSKSIPFLNKLRAQGGGLMASTYAAADGPYMIKGAIEKVKNATDATAIIKALETIEVKNAFWTWKFDKCHDAVKGYPYYSLVYGQHQGLNKYVVVWPEEIRKLTNPKDKFIPVKELRKMAAGK